MLTLHVQLKSESLYASINYEVPKVMLQEMWSILNISWQINFNWRELEETWVLKCGCEFSKLNALKQWGRRLFINIHWIFSLCYRLKWRYLNLNVNPVKLNTYDNDTKIQSYLKRRLIDEVFFKDELWVSHICYRVQRRFNISMSIHLPWKNKGTEWSQSWRLEEGQVLGAKEWEIAAAAAPRLWVCWGLWFLSGSQMALPPQHEFFLTNTQDYFSGKCYLGSNSTLKSTDSTYFIFKKFQTYRLEDEYNDFSSSQYRASSVFNIRHFLFHQSPYCHVLEIIL